jgi:hypothetical protein
MYKLYIVAQCNHKLPKITKALYDKMFYIYEDAKKFADRENHEYRKLFIYSRATTRLNVFPTTNDPIFCVYEVHADVVGRAIE